MLQLFSSIYGQDRRLLSDAYEAACDELQDDYHLSANELGSLVGPLVDALVSAYSAGQHDQKMLVRYAVSQVLNATLKARAKEKMQTDADRLSLQ